MDEMDRKALMSSEIFRIYAAQELNREAVERVNKPIKDFDAQLDKMELALTAVDKFEKQIRRDPELLEKFRNVQAFLLKNPDAHDKVDSNFVKGIMMLDLSEDK